MEKMKFVLILIMVSLFTFIPISNVRLQNTSRTDYSKIEDSILRQDSLRLAFVDSIRQEKICAVRDFMHKSAKNQGFNIEHITLTPEAIVDACETENFDIPFVMAAAKLESCFGLSKRAKRTNSVFAVGCYDNGKNFSFYDSQDECVVPYIKLLKEQYLGNGKTITDILKPGCFVSIGGYRYASNMNYESQMSNIRNNIIKSYPILLD